MKKRPKYLDLMKIRLPLPGFVSILHRASGLLLYLFIPLLLVALQCSLRSEQGYDSLAGFFASPLAKLLLLGLSWAFFHHFCAGIRFLFLDIDRGVSLQAARASSKAVLAASLLLTLVAGVLIW